jgi:hypothetical protein
MLKLTQIEKALLEIDPAGFQRLCDSYLIGRGYDRILVLSCRIASARLCGEFCTKIRLAHEDAVTLSDGGEELLNTLEDFGAAS